MAAGQYAIASPHFITGYQRMVERMEEIIVKQTPALVGQWRVQVQTIQWLVWVTEHPLSGYLMWYKEFPL